MHRHENLLCHLLNLPQYVTHVERNSLPSQVNHIMNLRRLPPLTLHFLLRRTIHPVPFRIRRTPTRVDNPTRLQLEILPQKNRNAPFLLLVMKRHGRSERRRRHFPSPSCQRDTLAPFHSLLFTHFSIPSTQVESLRQKPSPSCGQTSPSTSRARYSSNPRQEPTLSCFHSRLLSEIQTFETQSQSFHARSSP